MKTPETLTIIIRDDGPLIHCDDSPSYRTIRIALTDEQKAAITSKAESYERISRAIIE